MYWGHGDKSKCVMPSFLTLLFMCMSWLVPVEVTNKGLHLTELSVPDCTFCTGTTTLGPTAELILCIYMGRWQFSRLEYRSLASLWICFHCPEGCGRMLPKDYNFSNYFKAKTYKDCSFIFFFIPLGFSRLPTLKILRYLEPWVDREVGRWWAPLWSKEEAKWRHSHPSVASQGHHHKVSFGGNPLEDTSSLGVSGRIGIWQQIVLKLSHKLPRRWWPQGSVSSQGTATGAGWKGRAHHPHRPW